MRYFIFVFVIVIQSSFAQAPITMNSWVIWNVGQGQWVTHLRNDDCQHFDFGGEIQYFKYIQRRMINLCGKKTNRLYLSHGDLDHYSFIQLISQRVKSICWMIKPSDFKPLNLDIPQCPDSIGDVAIKNQTIINDCNPRDKNSCSTIFKREQFLFAGDSPKSKERLWIPLLEHKNEIKIIVLGHHGSRTSTSQRLIESLPELKMAVASARSAKYGHPHQETRALLVKNKIPLLKTESWGHVIFE